MVRPRARRAIAPGRSVGETSAASAAFRQREGTGYWSFGTTCQVILMDALRSVFGTPAGLDRPGFVKSPDFIAQMIAPSGADYDFSDAHGRNPAEPVMLWFARERRQRHIARELFASLEKTSTPRLRAPRRACSSGSPARNSNFKSTLAPRPRSKFKMCRSCRRSRRIRRIPG